MTSTPFARRSRGAARSLSRLLVMAPLMAAVPRLTAGLAAGPTGAARHGFARPEIPWRVLSSSDTQITDAGRAPVPGRGVRPAPGAAGAVSGLVRGTPVGGGWAPGPPVPAIDRRRSEHGRRQASPAPASGRQPEAAGAPALTPDQEPGWPEASARRPRPVETFAPVPDRESERPGEGRVVPFGAVRAHRDAVGGPDRSARRLGPTVPRAMPGAAGAPAGPQAPIPQRALGPGLHRDRTGGDAPAVPPGPGPRPDLPGGGPGGALGELLRRWEAGHGDPGGGVEPPDRRDRHDTPHLVVPDRSPLPAPPPSGPAAGSGAAASAASSPIGEIAVDDERFLDLLDAALSELVRRDAERHGLDGIGP